MKVRRDTNATLAIVVPRPLSNLKHLARRAREPACES
jgi:hypothetical protein